MTHDIMTHARLMHISSYRFEEQEHQRIEESNRREFLDLGISSLLLTPPSSAELNINNAVSPPITK